MDFSFAEFAIIGVVALLVIGPDKLPGLARTAGLWVGKVRGFINSVKTEIDAELKMDEIKNAVKGGNNSLHEISEIINETRNEFKNSINPNGSIKEAIDAPAPDDDVENKPDYQVKAIPDDFDDEDDSAHNDVEDDFIDDYNSDYTIDEIEQAPKPEPVKKATAKSTAKKKSKAKSSSKKTSKKKAKKIKQQTES
ncbi:MAG: Sec-independent protein translocase protein TatB [Gammaproteobacteria bacterium]